MCGRPQEILTSKILLFCYFYLQPVNVRSFNCDKLCVRKLSIFESNIHLYDDGLSPSAFQYVAKQRYSRAKGTCNDDAGVLGDKPISIGSLGGNFGNFCGRLCCLGGITIPQQCQKTCALIDCAPPTPLPVPGQCPNVRICCESGPKPPPCQELCKRVRIDCR